MYNRKFCVLFHLIDCFENNENGRDFDGRERPSASIKYDVPVYRSGISRSEKINCFINSAVTYRYSYSKYRS